MTVDELLDSTLRGYPTPWPEGAGGTTVEAFLDAARQHGVLALVYHFLHANGLYTQWPAVLRATLRRHTTAQAALEMSRRHEIMRILDALSREGIRVLLIKGAALAYLYYPHPWLRPRCDTDLFIRRSDRDRTLGVLSALGYAEVPAPRGELLTGQRMLARSGAFAPPHVVDMHWRAVNPHRYAGALSFELGARNPLAIRALGPAAYAPGTIFSFLLACLHRCAHHQESHRLIWLYDLHLLAGTLSDAEWEIAWRLAAERSIVGLCGRAIAVTRKRLGTRLPASAERTLAALVPVPHEVRLPRRRWQELWIDLRALGDWPSRLRLLREMAFPAADYMRMRYPRTPRVLLPFLYASRATSGVWKFLHREPWPTDAAAPRAPSPDNGTRP